MVHVGEISFCGKIAFNIKSDETKKYILERLEKLYQIKIVQKHYEKFNEKSLDILEKNPYLVCVRTNGNPYYLYLLKHNLVQYCIFIDKKIQQGYYLPRMIIVQLQFNDILFEDTVFEGEMIKSKDNNWFYIINDILAISGNHLLNVNLPNRINKLYDILNNYYTYDKYDPFKICVKEYFNYTELEYLITNHLEKLPYTSRGLYFKPLFLKFKDILFNFDDSLIKKVERFKYNNIKKFISNQDEIKIDNHKIEIIEDDTNSKIINTNNDNIENIDTKYFWIRKTNTPDIYDLIDNDNNILGIACVPTMKISKALRNIMMDKNMIDRVKLPFEYSEKFNKWIPKI